MKRTVLFLFAILAVSLAFAQKNNGSWAKVESLMDKQYYSQAYKVADSLFNDALKKSDSRNSLIGARYLSQIGSEYQENSTEMSLARYKEILPSLDRIDQAVCRFFLADFYSDYIKHNYYRVMNMSSDNDETDYRLWPLDRLVDTILLLVRQALSDPELLQSVSINQCVDLVESYYHSDSVRCNLTPTLYDILVEKLDEICFRYVSDYISLPEHKELLFAEPERFVEHRLTKRANVSKLEEYFFFVFEQMQNRERFHLQNGKDDAFMIQLYLERLEGVRMLESEVVYESEENFEKIAIPQIKKAIAHYRKNNDENITMLYSIVANGFDENERYEEAMAMIDTAIKLHPNSVGGVECYNLKQRILKKMVYVTIEEEIPSSSHRLGLAETRNVNHLYFRIVKSFESKNHDDEMLALLKKQKVLQQWDQPVEMRKDYKSQNTFFVLPPMPQGSYFLLVSSDSTFKKEGIALAKFQVIDIAYLSATSNYGPQGKGFIVDRTTGKPVAGDEVSLWADENTYSSGDYKKKTKLTTDKEGFFDFVPYIEQNWKQFRNYSSCRIVANHRGEKCQLSQKWGFLRNMYGNSRNSGVLFFFDRPIYKPGDTVYFTLVAYSNDRYEGNAEAGKVFKIGLYDINDKCIDKVSLTTDLFGQCSGYFVLHSSATPGSWSVRASGDVNARGTIRVEAYKQPKFTVTLSKPDGEQHYGKRVSVEGVAASYTAMPISGASVKYKIYHRTSTWKSGVYDSPKELVDNGEVTTDAEGLFTIGFLPTLDSSLARKREAVSCYYVYVTVTDINGETHEASTSVWMSTKSGYADIRVTDERDNLTLSVCRRNISGKSISGVLNFEVQRLVQPAKPKLSIPFVTDSIVPLPLPKKEFERLFPYLDYDRTASDCSKWPVEKSVFTDKVTTTPDSPYTFGFKGMAQGAYKVIATYVDEVGDTQRVEQYHVYEPSMAKRPVLSKLITATMDKTSYEVGEKAILRVGSRFEDVTLYVLINKVNTQYRHEIHKVSNGFVEIPIPVADSLIGGFNVEVTAVLDNQNEYEMFKVNVPYSNKELDVSFNTFRDKLQPGDKERWTISIKNKQDGTPADANLLMTMYDHALDSYGNYYMGMRFNPWSLSYTPSAFYDITDFETSYFYSKLDNNYMKAKPYLVVSLELKKAFFASSRGPRMYKATSTARGESGSVEEDGVEVENELGVVSAGDAVSSQLETVSIVAEKVPLIEVGTPESGMRLSSDDIKHMPAVDNGLTDNINSEVKMRQNLNTLAFYRPSLRSDKNGDVELSFTVPDLLTEWSIEGVAWTSELKTGRVSSKAVSQKRLMVVPNVPRFLRQGDTCDFSVKVSNMSGEAQDIVVTIQMTNAADSSLLNMVVGGDRKQLKLNDGASGEIKFRLAVPRENVYVANYKVIAVGHGVSDGEQAPIPLLPLRQMVTESMAFYINGAGEKHYEMKHLAELLDDKNPSSRTAAVSTLVVDVTANPMWLAIQSLPYVSRQNNPSCIYLANAVYSNSLSLKILKKNPWMKNLFSEWESIGQDAFMSALDRNGDLKQTIIDETPWLRDAVDEEQRHRDIAYYFNERNLNSILNPQLSALLDAQRPDGGWSWIPGGRWSSLYTTQYILKTFGLMKKQGVAIDYRTSKALDKAMEYVDRETYNYYKRWVKGTDFEPVNLDYLYVRSFYPNNGLTTKQKEAYDFFYSNAKKQSGKISSLFTQSMLSIVFHRNGDEKLAREMAVRIREKALCSDEMGMYWRDNVGGILWSQRPIETQAMLIRTFSEVLGDKESVAKMQQWLLKQKQTTNWSSDVSTVNAIQALLVGSETFDGPAGNYTVPSKMKVTYGSHQLQSDTSSYRLHLSQRLSAKEITVADSRLTVEKSDPGIAWGAMYLQYFEDVDKIPSSSTGVTIKRTLYKVENDGKLKRIDGQSGGTVLNVGDRVRVRLVINVDRALEYVEIKEPRCAAFEPVNTSSGWCWNDGLSYYRAVTNASQTLYVDRVEKGDYLVETDYFVNNSGTFVTAPVTFQSLYAPEFRALCPVEKLTIHLK